MTTYTSIEELQAKCEEMKQAADKKRTVCRLLWEHLTAKEEKKTFKTPTQRILDNADKAAMIFDGVLFGTKVYHLFKGRKEVKKKSLWKRLFNVF